MEPKLTAAETLLNLLLGAGPFVGGIVYGVKKGHPWAYGIAGLVAGGALSGAHLALIGKSYMPNGATTTRAGGQTTVVTGNGGRTAGVTTSPN